MTVALTQKRENSLIFNFTVLTFKLLFHTVLAVTSVELEKPYKMLLLFDNCQKFQQPPQLSNISDFIFLRSDRISLTMTDTKRAKYNVYSFRVLENVHICKCSNYINLTAISCQKQFDHYDAENYKNITDFRIMQLSDVTRRLY